MIDLKSHSKFVGNALWPAAETDEAKELQKAASEVRLADGSWLVVRCIFEGGAKVRWACQRTSLGAALQRCAEMIRKLASRAVPRSAVVEYLEIVGPVVDPLASASGSERDRFVPGVNALVAVKDGKALSVLMTAADAHLDGITGGAPLRKLIARQPKSTYLLANGPSCVFTPDGRVIELQRGRPAPPNGDRRSVARTLRRALDTLLSHRHANGFFWQVYDARTGALLPVSGELDLAQQAGAAEAVLDGYGRFQDEELLWAGQQTVDALLARSAATAVEGVKPSVTVRRILVAGRFNVGYTAATLLATLRLIEVAQESRYIVPARELAEQLALQVEPTGEVRTTDAAAGARRRSVLVTCRTIAALARAAVALSLTEKDRERIRAKALLAGRALLEERFEGSSAAQPGKSAPPFDEESSRLQALVQLATLATGEDKALFLAGLRKRIEALVGVLSKKGPRRLPPNLNGPTMFGLLFALKSIGSTLGESDRVGLEEAGRQCRRLLLASFNSSEHAYLFRFPGDAVGTFRAPASGQLVRLSQQQTCARAFALVLDLALTEKDEARQETVGLSDLKPEMVNVYRPARRVSFVGGENQLLFGRVEGIKFDIDRLRKYLAELLATGAKPVEYAEGDQSYFGWSITSSDGQQSSGVRHLTKAEVIKAGGIGRMAAPTPLYFGTIRSVIETMQGDAYFPSRARVMKLMPGADKMAFHRDEHSQGFHKWRFHIALDTNETALFEWQIGKRITSVHIPADGHVYAVNVSHPHRAINPSTKQSRTHFLCSLLNESQRIALERSSIVEV